MAEDISAGSNTNPTHQEMEMGEDGLPAAKLNENLVNPAVAGGSGLHQSKTTPPLGVSNTDDDNVVQVDEKSDLPPGDPPPAPQKCNLDLAKSENLLENSDVDHCVLKDPSMSGPVTSTQATTMDKDHIQIAFQPDMSIIHEIDNHANQKEATHVMISGRKHVNFKLEIDNVPSEKSHNRRGVKLTPIVKPVKPKTLPLKYETKTLCDFKIISPRTNVYTGEPDILITKTDGTTHELKALESIASTSHSGDDKRVYKSKPLSYETRCLCDFRPNISTMGTQKQRANDLLPFDMLLNEINSQKGSSDINLWPGGTPSNEHVWDDLPPDTNNPENVKKPENSVPQSVLLSVSADDAQRRQDADTVTHLHPINSRRDPESVKSPPRVSESHQDVVKLTKRGHSQNPIVMKNLKSFFMPASQKPVSDAILTSTTSAESSETLKSSSVIFDRSAELIPSQSESSIGIVDQISVPKVTLVHNTQSLPLLHGTKIDDWPNVSQSSKFINSRGSKHKFDDTLQNLLDLEDEDDNDSSSPQTSTPPLPPRTRSCKARKMKRARRKLSQVHISSEEDLDTSALDNHEINMDPELYDGYVSACLQGAAALPGADDVDVLVTEMEIDEILKKEIDIIPNAKEDFRKCRGSLTGEAKAVVRAQHLRAMAAADRIPKWAFGMDTTPQYCPRNEEWDTTFLTIIKDQAKERMRRVADKMDAKAAKFREMAGAGYKAVRHYYPPTDAGNSAYKDCKLLLKALSFKDKLACLKSIQRTEVEVGDSPVTDEDLITEFLRPMSKEDKKDKPMVFRPASDKKTDGENQPEDGEIPSAAATEDRGRDKKKKSGLPEFRIPLKKRSPEERGRRKYSPRRSPRGHNKRSPANSPKGSPRRPKGGKSSDGGKYGGMKYKSPLSPRNKKGSDADEYDRRPFRGGRPRSWEPMGDDQDRGQRPKKYQQRRGPPNAMGQLVYALERALNQASRPKNKYNRRY